MRRILNNQKLRDSVIEFNKKLFTSRSDDFEMPYQRLRFLNKHVVHHAPEYGDGAAEKLNRYVKKIRRQYSRILNADDVEILKLIAEFEEIIPHAQIKEKFWKAVVWAMRYDAIRDQEFLKILNPLGIKTCVYCHSQLTLVIKKKIAKNKVVAKGIVLGDVLKWKGLLELDHRHPKSKYPFLCTSFFNLYPICGSCNKAKNDNHSDFSLYHEGPDLNLFHFSLPDNAVVEYLKNKNREAIVINFTHINQGIAENDKLAADYDKMFSISGIYGTQKDIIEELIHKQQVYTKDYNKALIKDFTALFPDKGLFTRLVIGTYENENDVFRRPMSKFIQDISRNIQLIDEHGNLCQLPEEDPG
ncbi:hypothetical protein [Pedobacter miscanthi]|uniref:hypothetical protein n=1 Tax=Pedobacter miscanthi TaxID=2259170 RepID=UPI002931A014|nr:hypothetical protein [Pedobacter miscanthi]